ncbi:MAG TPA: hypothetical protein VGL81_22595 [Polyangiaceae bacterium]|jgi:catechol 2,3-dioxygenase-like lactoylglutathione lyase family enzyme
MIHGSHVIVYSKDSEADRNFFRDVLGYSYADAGHGWLIFALPPAEIAFHPTEGASSHELYLMCDDMKRFLGEMRAQGVPVAEPSEERWGVLTQITLPSGGKLGVYEPRHASPLKKRAAGAAQKTGPKASKKAAKKKASKKAGRR